MVNLKIFSIFFVLLFLVPFLSAETSIQSLGIFEKDTNIELLQVCSNSTSLCDSCNISSVKYPNSSISISNVDMTKREADFNYSLISNYTSPLGTYKVNGFCMAGNELKVFSYIFEVTANGNEKPEGIVIVLFILFFTLIIVSLLSLLMYNIFHMVQWDFDANDLIYNFSGYFALFVIYILGKEYMGNIFINDMLIWLIGIAAVTHIILPVIAFVLTYVRGNLSQQNGN